MTTYTPRVKPVPALRETDDAQLYRKVLLRLIPVLFISQIFAFLDRVNIGFAKTHMTGDLGLSAAQYGLAAGVFFVGNMLLEIPSNLWLHRFGARKSLFRIMLLWGLVSSATMFVRTPHELVLMRFVLGLCEAGFWPGVLLYLTYWFPAARRANAVAICLLAPTAAGVLAGPLSGWILGNLDGAAGLHGWQWMFLIEGIPACFVGVLLRIYLPDGPRDAGWLRSDERARLMAALADESAEGRGSGSHTGFDRAHWRTTALFAFLLACVLSGVFLNVFWLPTIIREAGVHGDLRIGLYSVVPYLVSGLVMVLVSRHSDAHGERRWHFAGSMFVAAIGLAMIAQGHASLAIALPGICLLGSGLSAALAVFWALPPAYLPKSSLPGAIAAINMIGGIGAMAGPWLIGLLRDRTGSVSLAMAPFCVLLLIAAICAVVGTRKRSMIREPL
ncbi:MFS transporter [Paraburkholderia pallida]|uniref:MFS transporter n=1 Tax=Paraburkholderia pallida TaxID=2547399 RepID=A0A4P7DAJ9_9BURK|nr:MFS transporter [Paraburkholderia pallida]QBR04240.1 MFS transporter [Paraburkholderia pallida]